MTARMRGLGYPLLLAVLIVSVGCGAEKSGAEPQSNIADSVGLESGRVGSIRVDEPLDSVMQRATLIGEELRTSIGGGDLERYLQVAIGNDTVEIVAINGRVGAIHVRSPRWRTAEGLGVGTSALELSRYPLRESDFWAEGLFVRLQTHCGVYFVLSKAYVDSVNDDDKITAEQLAKLGDSTRVSMVVVEGAC